MQNTSFGAYLGPGAGGAARVPAFTAWFGRTPDRGLDFIANDTWPSFESDGAWTAASWTGVVTLMTFSVPLTVNGTSLADVAAGLHDSSFSAVAKALVNAKCGAAVIRLGWEFNGSWMPWAATNPSQYVAAFRHVVALMRSISSAFTFDWCTAWGINSTLPDSAYPGDDVVDFIGMDVYNRYYAPVDADPVHRWNTILTSSYGLNWLVAFAKLHSKPISITEWGTGEWTGGDGGTGGGDDPIFVSNMAAFMEANSVRYCSYWDINAGSYNACVSDGEHPLSGAALKTAFGAQLQPPGPILWIGPGEPPTNTSVSINFSPPYEGGPVDHFDIAYREVAWTKFGSVNKVGTQPVTGLNPGTAYEVRVTAVNAAGNGTPSAPLLLSTI